MDMSDTLTPKRQPWAPIPLKTRKQKAIKLVTELLSGERKAEALFWVQRRRYTPRQLENFISAMERGLAAREKRGTA